MLPIANVLPRSFEGSADNAVVGCNLTKAHVQSIPAPSSRPRARPRRSKLGRGSLGTSSAGSASRSQPNAVIAPSASSKSGMWSATAVRSIGLRVSHREIGRTGCPSHSSQSVTRLSPLGGNSAALRMCFRPPAAFGSESPTQNSSATGAAPLFTRPASRFKYRVGDCFTHVGQDSRTNRR